ncbi:MAG: cob(I)yrinic acid a,c-diamide adenosyltransferase [Duncaniella sp.]|uniref:cob(I)yrinic acid a,c-diamide adenosyltransferase n=1 Tax=Duncaniella sp. TaxID=2518496 RepID=UPI0023D26F68|nr:cob(I)yrinic acid a,c-diamide adenosyltransferase [Duncaniella sp.]MDE5989527.1 cob(I)yrinic acid a,c-diamide adenosyltransferase [Duncaniella sp.]
MKKSLLYTRTGDAGTTSLIGGQRVAKNSPRVNAYGTLDELNAHIGLVQARCAELDNFVTATLLSINNTLFNLGAYLATPPAEESGDSLPKSLAALPDRIAELEKQIDTLDAAVPEQRTFILPGGSIGAAHAHVARTVCRRAEREILNLADTGEPVAPIVLTYINRLSDYLFILARYINHFTGTPDIPWQQS